MKENTLKCGFNIFEFFRDAYGIYHLSTEFRMNDIHFVRDTDLKPNEVRYDVGNSYVEGFVKHTDEVMRNLHE